MQVSNACSAEEPSGLCFAYNYRGVQRKSCSTQWSSEGHAFPHSDAITMHGRSLFPDIGVWCLGRGKPSLVLLLKQSQCTEEYYSLTLAVPTPGRRCHIWHCAALSWQPEVTREASTVSCSAKRKAMKLMDDEHSCSTKHLYSLMKSAMLLGWKIRFPSCSRIRTIKFLRSFLMKLRCIYSWVVCCRPCKIMPTCCGRVNSEITMSQLCLNFGMFSYNLDFLFL